MAKHRRKKLEEQRSDAPRKAKRSLLSHPALAVVLGLWGAALGGAVVLMLPPPVIGTIVGEGDGARLLAAGIAALVLGAICALAGLALVHRARTPAAQVSPSERTTARYRTIDPARDLGSESFDAPLETTPFAGLGEALSEGAGEPDSEPLPIFQPERTERAEGPYGRWLRSMKLADPVRDHAFDPDQTPAESPAEAAADEPVALDLAQFAALPGRNAVWVDDTPEPTPAPAPAVENTPDITPMAPASPSPLPMPSAIAKLRAVPPSELSLVQMVERFAVALHEQQEPGSTGARRLPAQREAALAEALRQLAQLTGDKQQGERIDDDDLHAALRRLQQLRGAA